MCLLNSGKNNLCIVVMVQMILEYLQDGCATKTELVSKSTKSVQQNKRLFTRSRLTIHPWLQSMKSWWDTPSDDATLTGSEPFAI